MEVMSLWSCAYLILQVGEYWSLLISVLVVHQFTTFHGHFNIIVAVLWQGFKLDPVINIKYAYVFLSCSWFN